MTSSICVGFRRTETDMSNSGKDIDWTKTTWEGSRREQLRAWCALTLRERLLAVEEMAALSDQFAQMRAQGRMQYPNGKQESDIGSESASGVQESGQDYVQGTVVNEIVLDGCTPTPLANYLKALGVLRLLSTKYPFTRGSWRDDGFVLHTTLDRADIEQFFLEDYAPTPIISPWSGRAGFLEGDDGKTSKRKGAAILARIEQAKGARFQPYKKVVSAIRDVSIIKQLDRARAERKVLEALKKAKNLDTDGLERLAEVKREEAHFKGALLSALRGEVDDTVLPWIDACFALHMEERTPSPMLGSGGNEGSMDFSINHVGYLLKLIDENSDDPTLLGRHLLTSSLFGGACPRGSSSNIGFLDTLATGGINMSTGFEGQSSGNIWDSVFALEGVVMFASGSTKRLESTASGRPSFPFAVSPSFAGAGSLAAKESARPEMWLPFWNKPTSITEIAALLAEGRVTKGKRQARNGIDMLEAVTSLGATRGINAFNRFGFYERRGQGYYVATHLGHFEVPATASSNWMLADLNQHGWLDQFRKFAQDGNTANRFRVLRKLLEDGLFDLAGREPSKAKAQALLTLLGEIQIALSSSNKAVESVRPVPRLSGLWVQAADDGTPAFRIAKALAGLRGVGNEPLPLRAQLFPVHRRFDQWMTPEAGEEVRIHTWHKGRLVNTLHALLQRRLWLAQKLEMKDKPLASNAGATAEDVTAFLRDDRMDKRIAALLPGLSLCEIPPDIDHSAGDGTLPAAFGLLKLALTPDRTLHRLDRLGEHDRLPLPVGMLAQLKAGNHGNCAVQAAWRRLRSSGVTPVFSINALPTLDPIDTNRAAAALMIPLRFGATGALTRQVLNKLELEDNTA